MVYNFVSVVHLAAVVCAIESNMLLQRPRDLQRIALDQVNQEDRIRSDVGMVANKSHASSLVKNACEATMSEAPQPINDAMSSICSEEVTELSNADFKAGTYVIEKPGIYRLTQNIVMHPEGPDVTARMHPKKSSEKYSFEKGYWLGFFAAIAITTDNVFIDLNGKSIEQSPLFQRRQRFFQTIQLGNKPFDAGAGPPQFHHLNARLVPANKVVVTGGTIGRSSHMAIHGTNVEHIWVHKVIIKEFEVGGVQINGCRYCYITQSEVGPSSTSVPALATLSQANLLLRIIDAEEPEMDAKADQAFTALRDAVDDFIVEGNCADCDVFQADATQEDGKTLPDGSALYGILFHKSAPAVHDFMSCSDEEAQTAETFGPVVLQDVTIRNLWLRTDEIATMQLDGKVVLGPAGDVFQVHRLQVDGLYKGNVLSDAQLHMGQLCNELATDKSADEVFELCGSTNIPSAVIEWALDESSPTTLGQLGGSYVCNQDAMSHFNKGVMGIRLSFVDDASLERVTIENLHNFGKGSTHSACQSSESSETKYKGNDVRGVVASLSTINVTDVQIKSLQSDNGFVYEFDKRHKVTVVGDETMLADDVASE